MRRHGYSMIRKVQPADPKVAVETLMGEIRRLRLALEDIAEIVEDQIDIDNNEQPNMAMRISVIIKQALVE